MIPKIIWQTHDYPFNNAPNDLKNTINLLTNRISQWNYRYIDKAERKRIIKDNNMLYRMYINIDEAFQKEKIVDGKVFVANQWRDYNYAKSMYRSDIFRIIVMYEYGGLYMDADTVITQDSINMIESTDFDLYSSIHAIACSNCNRPLREIEGEKVRRKENQFASIFNIYGIDAMAAKPKLDLFKDLIDKLIKNNSITRFQEFYTEAVENAIKSSQLKINTELDTIEFNRLEDRSILPIRSDKLKILREEREILCPCMG